eukprot:835674-Amphidinium_carterae.1
MNHVGERMSHRHVARLDEASTVAENVAGVAGTAIAPNESSLPQSLEKHFPREPEGAQERLLKTFVRCYSSKASKLQG